MLAGICAYFVIQRVTVGSTFPIPLALTPGRSDDVALEVFKLPTILSGSSANVVPIGWLAPLVIAQIAMVVWAVHHWNKGALPN